MASEACPAVLDRWVFLVFIMIKQTHIPQFIGDIHRTYTIDQNEIISTRHCYKTATIQKQPREKRHVNVLWSAVKDFENNFAPKKITYIQMFYNYVKNVNILGTAPGRISDYSG